MTDEELGPGQRGRKSGALLLAYLDAVPTCWAWLMLTPEQIEEREDRAEGIAEQLRQHVAENRRAAETSGG